MRRGPWRDELTWRSGASSQSTRTSMGRGRLRCGSGTRRGCANVSARSRARFIVVIGHHPPLPLGTPWLDSGLHRERRGVARRAGRLMRASRPTSAGTCIRTTATAYRGLQLLTTPSTCFQFVAATQRFCCRRNAAGMALARSRVRRYPHVPRGSRDRLCGDPRPFGIQKTLRAYAQS